jgi:LacI family transcriptional regulator
MKRPTQADVARLANVSRATVSYVLSNRIEGRVPISQDTARRVLDAARELRYEPDARAHALRLGNTKIIGLLVPDLRNPHFWQIIYGIEETAHKAGYDLLLLHSALNQKEENECIKSLAHRKVDGLILLLSFTPLSPDAVDELIQTRNAIVDISEYGSPFDTVLSNYEEGTRKLMTHLLELGHRRIGFIYGVAKKEIGNDRLLPYRVALEEAGLTPEPDLVAYCGTTIDDGYRAASHLLSQKNRPTALVVINDLLSIGAMRAARDMKIDIPMQLSLAGFDDIPLAAHLSPRLTTVHRDTEKCGALAVDMLLNRLKNPKLPQQVEKVESFLVIRESTGPAPLA